MVNRPSVPEIITVNSEQLQTQIRDLLPSQSGFGSELQASNVITPVIDLTSAAEGSGLPTYLQTAIAFGSQTAFAVANTTTTILSTTGFYRIFGVATARSAGSTNQGVSIDMTDGVSTKTVYEFKLISGTSGDYEQTSNIDFTVFLRAGDSVSVTSTSNATFNGSTRQVATGDGTLIQPNGFPL